MSESPPDVVRSLFAAIACAISGEPREELYSLLHPEVEWIPINAALEGVSYRGHEGVDRWIDEMRGDWKQFEALPEDFLDLGNERLLALGTWRARGRLSGVALESEPAAWLIQLRDRKVVRMQTFTDRAEALRVAAVWT